MSTKLRVAISGAGIGGLALAVTIGKYSDIPIDLYEAGPEITTVGAGISISKRVRLAMQELGLDEELSQRAIPNQEAVMTYRRADLAEEGTTFFRQAQQKGIMTVHRAEMVDILKKHLPKTCTIHLSKRLSRYTHVKASSTTSSRAIMLHFSDGSIAEADVLIGADGIRSATRATMYELLAVKPSADTEKYRRFKDPIWSGTVAYRGLVPTEKINAIDPGHRAKTGLMSYCGKDKHIITYPISQGRLINVVAFCTDRDGEGTKYKDKWVVETPRQELIDRYQGWETEVQMLLQSLENPSRWAVHVMESLPLFVSDHVAIMGDAAHAMTPHFGAGAGQAIEDAYILGRVLAHNLTTKENVSQAMSVYEEIRLPIANKVVQDARAAGNLYEFSAPGYYDGKDQSREKEELENMKTALTKVWDWEKKVEIEEQWERAEKRLRDQLHA